MESEKTAAVANEFLNLEKEEGSPICNLKLIKLLYVAQGLSLSLLDKELFSEPIEAWRYGPVIPSIYHEFKHFGKDLIDKPSITLDEYGEKVKVDELYDEEEKRIVKLTWNLYKNIDAKKLIELTHKKGTPWDLTYMPQENKIIDNALIKRYYKKFMKNLKKEQMSSRKSSDNRNKRTLSFRGSRIII